MKKSFKKQILLTVLTVVLVILFTDSISAVKVIPLGEVNRPISINVDDAYIYPVTYGKKNGKTEVLVLDLKGKLLKTVFLPLYQRDDELAMTLENRISRQVTNSTFAIKNGNFYQVLENQDGESWELHIHEIK